ncbi:hypothetical protein FHP88_15670 [Sedimenticola selenatireducens]|uniref:Uncharacterized protein n=1 Tax=Sedimenticola selenatireducens TaxID=191960 RepID=A0A557S0D7_9GAMM|nr:terminase family protein [Sedimenticola selenatireducens]TVO70891.1 hypothetical protein FHP88_15670 [Sedimenticola selenatireducens]
MAERTDITEEAVEISQGERKDLLDLVEEKQQSRMGRLIPAAQVPKILLPYQGRWHADNSVVRLAEKSRRIGWSWGALAAEGALEAALPLGHPKGMDQFYMGYNMAMAAENIGDVVFFAQAYGFAISEIGVKRHREHVIQTDVDGKVIRNERRDITTYKVQFASGHVYEALSSNPHNWRGRQGHARIDEAGFHDNLQEVVKAALAFRLWGGRISIVSTHNGEDNQFNLWVRDIKAGKLNWSLHHVDFDQALADGFYKRICLVTGQKWSAKAEEKFRAEAFADYPDEADANEELLCIPKRGSGVYFSRILIEQCQAEGIPVVRWVQPEEWVIDPTRLETTDRWLKDTIKPLIDNLPLDQRTVYGQDFGRDGDLSVIWILQNDSPLHWRTALLIELRKIPFDVQALIRDYVLSELPLLHAAKFDARGNGQSHAEGAMQRFGPNRIECVMLTAQWYAVAFPKYKSAYEGRNITVPKSEDIIADHRRVVLHKGRPHMDDGRDKGSDGMPRHGDSAVAGLLAWMAALDEGEPAYGETVDSDDLNKLYAPESARGRRQIAMFRRS